RYRQISAPPSCGQSEIRDNGLGRRSTRISDSKPHEQLIDSSVVLGFKVPECACHAVRRNFKSTHTGPPIVTKLRADAMAPQRFAFALGMSRFTHSGKANEA